MVRVQIRVKQWAVQFELIYHCITISVYFWQIGAALTEIPYAHALALIVVYFITLASSHITYEIIIGAKGGNLILTFNSASAFHFNEKRKKLPFREIPHSFCRMGRTPVCSFINSFNSLTVVERGICSKGYSLPLHLIFTVIITTDIVVFYIFDYSLSCSYSVFQAANSQR